jgi:hypothetical protein
MTKSHHKRQISRDHFFNRTNKYPNSTNQRKDLGIYPSCQPLVLRLGADHDTFLVEDTAAVDTVVARSACLVVVAGSIRHTAVAADMAVGTAAAAAAAGRTVEERLDGCCNSRWLGRKLGAARMGRLEEDRSCWTVSIVSDLFV